MNKTETERARPKPSFQLIDIEYERNGNTVSGSARIRVWATAPSKTDTRVDALASTTPSIPTAVRPRTLSTRIAVRPPQPGAERRRAAVVEVDEGDTGDRDERAVVVNRSPTARR